MSTLHLFVKKQNTVGRRIKFAKTGRIIFFLVFLFSIAAGFPTGAKAAEITFSGSELLGRPTDSSITINIVPASSIQLFYEYGTASGDYDWQTSTASATGGQPNEVIISGLQPNTKYYYRMQYSTDGGSSWTLRSEHSFWTQRSEESTFTFTVTSDSHVNIMLGSASEWTKTMNNVANDHPDFEIDLGDTFAMDSVTSVSGAESSYLTQRQYFDLVGNSASIFLSPGNHEQQEAWHLDDTGNPATSPPVLGTNAQKKFYPNPVPGGFYTGDLETYSYLDGDHLREDYYAWTWGDALFVVIDPYWFTTTKPYSGNTGGGESSDTGSGNRWDWTLGQTQFNWLKQTLEESNAKYKFIFAHHMVGGSDDYVRGGANPANLVEWGGYNEAGTTYEWETKRPGWGSDPIHQILVDNGVSAFFHGHDHQYAYEERDGVVYQSVPSAGFSGSGFNIYTTGSGYTIQALPSDGHLRVTVSPEKTTVDYVKTTDASVAYSYDIESAAPSYDLTISANPSGGGTTNPAVGVHSYTEGSTVNVTATGATGYVFDHWSGACSGSGSCSVTMNADKTVTANFVTAPTFVLTTAVTPSGGGTINPAAGPHSYNQGVIVPVTATPNSGYEFSNWSGACTGSGSCSVTMNATKSVTAIFTAIPTYVLTTAVNEAGSGTIVPAEGDHPYNEGEVVAVTATPSSGYAFSSWSGACTGSGICSVTMNSDKNVIANFIEQVDAITFTGTELLGRPEANSISVNIVPDSNISLYYQYGTTSGGPYASTSTVSATGGQPKLVVMNGLSPNTKYYYRMQYSSDGGSTWTARPENSFWTQRADGSTFSFTITSDSHVNILLGGASTWNNTLDDIATEDPDFEIDLGDTVAMRSVNAGDSAGAVAAYVAQLPFFNRISASVPVFLVAGNHEQKEGWHLLSPLTGSLPVIGTNAQKKYFPNPVPDLFYLGDSSTYSYLDGDHLREDYYAWEWGDALFVVIDPYWFSTSKPYVSDPGGGESDTTGTGDSWDWTLGQDQFNWLKSTLQNSTAKYKFVFSHQMVGGGNISGQSDYGHGGANYANLVEWGGYDEDGSTWGWSTQRSGWGSQPIHQMMVANGVSAFFHGHDHQYAYEKLDGIVYQAVPSAGFSGNGFSIYTSGSGNTIQAMSNSGHLKVTVAPSQTTVDYIKTSTTTSAYSYNILPVGPTHNLTIATAGSGSGTVNPAVGVHSYAEGSIIPLEATAAIGSTFVGWSGNADCSDGSVTMNADKTCTATFSVNGTSPVSLDGTVSSGTVSNGSSISIAHTTGTGTNRLMLVGVSWNCGTTARTISSVTFTYGSGTVLTLNPVRTEQAGSQYRYSAIYSLLNPPSGQAGTVAINFSGSVSNGVVAGVANFAGVDQTTPLGTPNSANGNSTAPSVTLTGLGGDELVFDNVFQGASGSSQTLTAGSGQTPRWNDFVSNTRAAASTEQAAGSSVTMSWTAASSSYWAIVAVPINPSTVVTNYDLTMAVDPSGGGTVNPAVGVHTYAEDTVVNISATSTTGWHFDHWTGDVASPSSASTTVTMDENKTVTAVFVKDTVTLTVNVTGSGSVTQNPTAPYLYGDIVQLTAVAATGWHFDHWTGALSGSDNPKSITLDGNKSVTAVFAKDSVTLTVSVSGNGSVTRTPGGPYLYGDEVELLAEADPGWRFDHWTGALSGSDNPETILMNGNKAVTAVFVSNVVTLTVNVTGSGSVTQNPTGPYTYGDIVQLNEIAATGWHFVEWTVDLSGSENPKSITLNGNKSVTAVFAKDTVTLTVNVTGNGSVTRNPTGPYLYGDEVELTPVPDTGWHFVEWTGDLSGSVTPKSITLNGNKSVTAVFAKDTVTLTVNVTGNGSVTRNPTGPYLYGDEVVLTPVPDTGWHFVEWTGDLTGSVTPKSITLTGNKSVTAVFAKDTVTLTVNVTGNGSVTQNPLAPYLYGDVVQLTAIPASTWHFSQWSDALSGSVNPKTITLDGNKIVTAIFTENNAPAITEGDSTDVVMTDIFALTLHASDVDGDTLTWSINSQASHGTAAASGTGLSKVINYSPNPGYLGTDSFVVQVDDAHGGVDTTIVNVTINPVNNLPTIGEGSSIVVTMSENGTPLAFTLTLHAGDEDGDTLNWSISTQASNGTAVASGTGTSKAIGYTPVSNYVGTDSFVVRVEDGKGGSAIITVNVTINPSYSAFLPVIIN